MSSLALERGSLTNLGTDEMITIAARPLREKSTVDDSDPNAAPFNKISEDHGK